MHTNQRAVVAWIGVLLGIMILLAGPAGSLLAQEPAASVASDCEGCPPLVTLADGTMMGQHLVTRDEFAVFAEATGFEGKGCLNFNGLKPIQQPDADWQEPGIPQEGDHPVVCVSWLDATAYADWLTENTGKSYRLPTVEESAAAAAAGATTKFSWGDDISAVCTYANGADASYAFQYPEDDRSLFACDDGYAYTAPVTAFPPNGWGIYDGTGNAWQWTNSCLNGDCANAVFRGGGWNVPNPKFFDLKESFGGRIGLRNTIIGFRVMRDPD